MKFKHVLTHASKADLGIYYVLSYEELPKQQVAGPLPSSVRAHAMGVPQLFGVGGRGPAGKSMQLEDVGPSSRSRQMARLGVEGERPRRA